MTALTGRRPFATVTNPRSTRCLVSAGSAPDANQAPETLLDAVESVSSGGATLPPTTGVGVCSSTVIG
jgi:hypothetical protein